MGYIGEDSSRVPPQTLCSLWITWGVICNEQYFVKGFQVTWGVAKYVVDVQQMRSFLQGWGTEEKGVAYGS